MKRKFKKVEFLRVIMLQSFRKFKGALYKIKSLLPLTLQNANSSRGHP